MPRAGSTAIGKLAAFVVAYALVGKLALILATPGGYATAIFPPAGLAMVAVLMVGRRAWPGIWLGSLVLNLWVGIRPEHWLTIQSVGIAAGIATASLFQAHVGAKLVRRAVPTPQLIHSAGDVARFLIWGGPVACLVAPTVATVVLRTGGAIGTEGSAITWATWWIGDTIGVLIVAPLALMFWPNGHPVWRERSIRILASALVSISLVGAWVAHVDRKEHQRLRGLFDQRAQACTVPYRADLQAYGQVITSLAGYVESKPALDPEGFKAFVRRLYTSVPGIHALSWCPRVEAAERAHFEALHAAALATPFRITEFGPGGAQGVAGKRPDYFPVALIEPKAQNLAALGLDLASEPVRRALLYQLIQEGGLHATGRIRLAQSPDGVDGILAGQAVRHPDGRLRGVVTVVFFVPAFTHALAAEAANLGLAARMVDRSSDAGGKELLPWTAQAARNFPEDLVRTTSIEWGGRAYELQLRPAEGFSSTFKAWTLWALLATGLVLAGLIEAALLVVPGAPRAEAARG